MRRETLLQLPVPLLLAEATKAINALTLELPGTGAWCRWLGCCNSRSLDPLLVQDKGFYRQTHERNNSTNLAA